MKNQSRITITNQGQQLRKEVQDQRETEVIQEKQNKKKEQQLKLEREEKFFSQLDITQQVNSQFNNLAGSQVNGNNGIASTIKKMQQKNSPQDILASFNYSVIRKCNNVQKIQNFLLPQQKHNRISPYIKTKLEQATKDILNTGMDSGKKQNTKSKSTNELPKSVSSKTRIQFNQTKNDSLFSNTINSFHPKQFGNYNQNDNIFQQGNQTNTTFNRNLNGNKSSLEEIMNERQNKMVLYESKFSKMYENHQRNMENKEQLKQSKHDLRSIIEKSSSNITLSTRPETLQEINNKHPEALEIISFSSNARKREQEILYNQHYKTYGQKWNKGYFPMSKQERVDLGLPQIEYKPKLTAIKREYHKKGKKDGWVY